VATETDPLTPGTTPRQARTRAGTVGVSLVLVAAGLLFTTSAATAHGTNLRSDRADLADLLAAENSRVAAREKHVAALDSQVARDTEANAANNQAVASLEKRSASVIAAAGLLPVAGPGLTVTLDDAPRDSSVPASAGPDDLVVHQQDVQAVVNALWAGGAEAMTLMGQRVISTSAVRCVGNTIVLQGQVYGPPFVVTALGDPDLLRDALDREPGVELFRRYVDRFGLGYDVSTVSGVTLPAYTGSLELPSVSSTTR